MKEIVKNTIELYDLCPKNTQITLGISGGADSIAMLHFFITHREMYNWTLHAVHIHHGIRGREADRDARFVLNLCKRHAVPCGIFQYDVPALAKKEKKSIEEMGRIVRYETFQKLATLGQIAVAHNEDDQAETVLMHLARGSGLKGLCGMEVKNGAIVRPLLFVSRKEIEQYCTDHHLTYQTDSTNKHTIYDRNRMRLTLLPLLSEMYGDGVKHRIARTAEILREEHDFLKTATAELYENAVVETTFHRLSFSLDILRNSHKAILHRLYFLALKNLGVETNISSLHIDMISDILHDTKMKEIHLPKEICIKTSYSELIFEKDRKEIGDFYYELPLSESIFVKECNLFVEISVISAKNSEIIPSDYTKVFDYDKIKETICCRNRKTGDTIGIFRDKETQDLAQKTLKKDFGDRKIPKDTRDSIPLIASGHDILWAVGVTTSKKYEPTTNTKNHLLIELWRNTDERTSGSHVDSRRDFKTH
ncbi:MAG: tRNA lysidine(34) synthetase TilS [Bacillota bacterium]